MRSINDLAVRANMLYAPKGVTEAMYTLWLEEGFRLLAHRSGGLYTATYEQALTPGTSVYTLPADCRQLKSDGVYLYYAQRTITTAVRTSNVVTITTSAAHNLVAGVTVAIDGVTPVGATTFDDDEVTVATVPLTTTFTYAQTATNDTGTGGTVNSTETSETFLNLRLEQDVIAADWQLTQGDPTEYYFVDGLQYGLIPVPDGAYPTLTLRYDAEAPSSLSYTTVLPGPIVCEAGMLGYAHARAARLVGDERMMLLGMQEFEGAVRLWNDAQALHMQLGVDTVNEWEF